MKTSWPRISIVTPVCNGVKYIEACIKSVVEQNYPNIEYIIIDGGSVDGTVDIIKRYDNNISYWESVKDRGQTHAINKGFRLATGEIYAWLNSDEEYIPGSLKIVGDTYRNNNNVDLIYGDRYCVDLEKVPPVINLNRITSIPPYPLTLYTGRTLFSDATFWTKKLHIKLGELNEKDYPRYAMDVEWFLRVASESNGFIYLKKPLSIYKNHGNNISAEGIKKGINHNEKIRIDYVKKRKINYIKFFFGWLWYSTMLRFKDRGILAIFIPPKWDTISRLFFKNAR